MPNHDFCQACGGGVVPEKVNLEDYVEGKLYLMENIDAYVCQECGEVWVPEETISEFEKMIDLAQKKNKRKKVKPRKG